jgi:hypothetical protein
MRDTYYKAFIQLYTFVFTCIHLYTFVFNCIQKVYICIILFELFIFLWYDIHCKEDTGDRELPPDIQKQFNGTVKKTIAERDKRISPIRAKKNK